MQEGHDLSEELKENKKNGLDIDWWVEMSWFLSLTPGLIIRIALESFADNWKYIVLHVKQRKELQQESRL